MNKKIVPTLGHSTPRFNEQFLDKGSVRSEFLTSRAPARASCRSSLAMTSLALYFLQAAKVAKRGRAALKANARRFAANVRPIIEEIVRSGITSHNAIAAKLNERNVRTARGGTWTHVQVGAILHPFDGASTAA